MRCSATQYSVAVLTAFPSLSAYLVVKQIRALSLVVHETHPLHENARYSTVHDSGGVAAGTSQQ